MGVWSSKLRENIIGSSESVKILKIPSDATPQSKKKLDTSNRQNFQLTYTTSEGRLSNNGHKSPDSHFS
jgi:hypothetical protein